MPFVSHRALGWPPVAIDASWGMQTIPQGMAYCICNTLHCLQCDLLFLDIRFSDLEMERYYNDYLGKEYEDLREFYEPGFRDRNKLLKAQHHFLHLAEEFIIPYINPKNILDWGGGTGINTPFANKGAHVDIFDIGNREITHGAQNISKNKIPSLAYDLIVCRHVLEHVPYPSEVLIEIRNAMHNEAILYIELPHERLMVENQCISSSEKKYWHEHINFFSISSMQYLLSICGFNIIKIQSTSIEFKKELNGSNKIIQIIANNPKHKSSLQPPDSQHVSSDATHA